MNTQESNIQTNTRRKVSLLAILPRDVAHELHINLSTQSTKIERWLAQNGDGFLFVESGSRSSFGSGNAMQDAASVISKRTLSVLSKLSKTYRGTGALRFNLRSLTEPVWLDIVSADSKEFVWYAV